MKLQIVTIGQPKLEYAKVGWNEYLKRLQRFHQVRVTHIPDKHNSAKHILEAVDRTYKVILEIEGTGLQSRDLAGFLETRALSGQEVSFVIGGPEGLPLEVREAADFQWSLSDLTLPHDLGMVVLLEALYRASTISAGLPYHK